MKIFLLSLVACFAIACLCTFSSTLWEVLQGHLAFGDSQKTGPLLSSTGVAGLVSASWLGLAISEEVASRRAERQRKK